MVSQPNMKFTDQQLIDCLQQGLSNRAIGRKFDVDEGAVRKRKAKLLNQGILTDSTAYALPAGHQLKGVTYRADGDGNLEPYWVKSKLDENENGRKNFIEAVVEAFRFKLPRFKLFARKSKHIKEDSLVVFPLGDPHIGMMAWSEECGENWDLKIAEEVFCRIFAEVLDDVPACAHCLIDNLGDWGHYDNMEGVTSRSRNVLDKDGRFLKMFQVSIIIARFMIDNALKKHDRVTWINTNGNHDDIFSQCMGEALKLAYENNSRVEILSGYKPIHYFQWGKVMVATHHGHTIKMDKLPGVISADNPSMWGSTEFRYCLTGHIHQDSVQALPGMQVESFSTLAAKDSFAAWHGYRSTRNQKAIVYTKEGGEKKRYITNLP